MRIVQVAHAFPPFPASGSRRAFHTARILTEAGHEVTTITSRLSGDEEAKRPRLEGLRIIPVRSWPTPLGIYARVKRRVASGVHTADAPPPPLLAESLQGGSRSVLRRQVVAFGLVPDDEQGFIPPAILCAFREVRRSADMLYTTAPPMSANVVGLIVKVATGVAWTAEYRDPWIVDGQPYKHPRWRTAATDSVERWLALHSVAAADQLVAVTRGIEGTLREHFAMTGQRPLAMIRNGIPRLLPSGVASPRGESIRIVHLGNFYAGRDPVPFFKGLAALFENGRLDRGRVGVEMIGQPTGILRDRIVASAHDLDLEGVVRFSDWVPYAEGQRLLESADLVLLIAQEQPLQVPNKLYEYLGLRRPILAFVDHDGETAQMLRRVGGHYLITERTPPAQVVPILEAALSPGERPGQSDDAEALLEHWSTAAQLAQLLGLIG